MAAAAGWLVIEGGRREPPRVAVAEAPELLGLAAPDRIPQPRSSLSTVRLLIGVLLSLAIHGGLVWWGLQHRADEEARAEGGANDPLIVEGESVILIDSVASEASLAEAKAVTDTRAPEAVAFNAARAADEGAPAPISDAGAATVADVPAQVAVDDQPSEPTPVDAAKSVDEARAAEAVNLADETRSVEARPAQSEPDEIALATDDAEVAAIAADTPVTDIGNASEATVESDSASAVSEEARATADAQVVAPTDTETAIVEQDRAGTPVSSLDTIVRPTEDSAPPPVEDAPRVVTDVVSRPVADVAPKVVANNAVAPVIEQPPKIVTKELPAKPVAKPKPAPASEQRSASVANDVARGPAQGNAGAGGASSEERGRADMSGYQAKLAAHLRRYRTFPAEARGKGISGVATVRFTVNRSGAVTSASLARSSGVGVLDQAAVDMVHRASPFPPIPPGFSGSTLTVSVPVRFDLR